MYGTPLNQRRPIGHFFMVVNLGDFIEPHAFEERMRKLVTRVRALDARGTTPVMVPGDPEKKAFAVQSRSGIPVDEDESTEFVQVSPEFTKAVVK